LPAFRSTPTWERATRSYEAPRVKGKAVKGRVLEQQRCRGDLRHTDDDGEENEHIIITSRTTAQSGDCWLRLHGTTQLMAG